MPNYNRILVAIDFSPEAQTVIEAANDLATRYSANLILVHVVEHQPPLDTSYEPMVTPAWEINEHELIERAETQLRKMVEQLELTSAERHVRLGPGKHEITRFADEQGADLIVVGSHGKHGIGLLLGSTANAVLHSATCDVLAVRVGKAG